MSLLTPDQIDHELDTLVELRHHASEAEAEHYRLRNEAGMLVEVADADIHDLLKERREWAHAMETIDGSDPAEVAAIAAAWDGFEAPEVTAYWDAVYGVLSVVTRRSRGLLPARQAIEELPGMQQDEHGCWLLDADDPMSAAILASPEWDQSRVTLCSRDPLLSEVW